MIKTRTFPEHNYKAIYCNYKTLRIALDPRKPITELEYPEFYDVKITNKCNSGCPWCYQDSNPDGPHFDNIIEKTKEFFGSMDGNQRPFQVAIGGGEVTLHPDFIELLQLYRELSITPNYTTNGMHITKDIIDATKKYCGGVAISCHPHLKRYWKKAIRMFLKAKVKLNLHLIISDRESVDYFLNIFEKYKKDIDYFVLLPYVTKGRAERKEVDYMYLISKLVTLETSKIAFGAKFYPCLLRHRSDFDISLYEPEILSAFIDFSDMRIYKSSFDLEQTRRVGDAINE